MSIKKIITTLYTALFVLVIFANFPIVEENFGIGTYGVIAIFSVLINAVFLTDLVTKKELFIKTPRSFILLIYTFLLLSLGLNYLSSSNQYFSLWGDQNGFTNTIIPMAMCFTLVLPFIRYYNSLESILNLLYTTALAVSLKSAFFLLITSLQNLDKNPTVLTENLQFYNHLLWVLLAQLVLTYKVKKPLYKNPATILAVLANILFLIFYPESISGLLLSLVFAISFTSLFYSKKTNKFTLNTIQLSVIFLTIFAAGMGVLIPAKYKYENSLKRLDFNNSTTVSLSALSDNPLLGNGKGTYTDAFSKHRPERLNESENWDKLFTMPYNQFYLDLTELGLLTTILIITIFVLVFKIINSNLNIHDDRAKLIFAVILSLIASYFLALWSLEILLIALLLFASLGHFENKKEVNIFAPIMLMVIVFGLVGISFHLYKCSKADYYFHQSNEAILNNDSTTAYSQLIKAKNTLKHKAEYRSEFAQLSLVIGEELFEKTKGTENEIEPLFAQSVREIKYTSEVLAPDSVPYWITKAVIYTKLESKYAGASENVSETYKTIIFLSPSQPLFRYQLAESYYNQGDYEKALTNYESALTLKPDYSLAKIGKAKTLLQLGSVSKAQDLLVEIGNDSKEDSAIRNQAVELLKQTPQTQEENKQSE